MKDESLGHKIKTLRKSKKLSQEKLAEKADLTQQHISRIEKGKTFPGIATLSKITKVLDVPLESLIDIDVKNKEDRYTLEILRKLEFLGVDDKHKIEGYIDRVLDENGIQYIK